MKKIRVPVTWECFGVVEVEVPDNLPKEKAIDMAIKIAKDDDAIPLPDDWEYVDSSWRVDDEGDLTRFFYDQDYPEGGCKMSTGSFKHNVVISDKNAAKTLLDAIEKASRPDNLNQEQNCFVPNDSAYPLCIGNGSPECEKCCVYENMDEPPFEK